jgi:hypothetical protein
MNEEIVLMSAMLLLFLGAACGLLISWHQWRLEREELHRRLYDEAERMQTLQAAVRLSLNEAKENPWRGPILQRIEHNYQALLRERANAS